MKVVILAGGLGTRLSEETSIRPKPMVEIGGRPILWHIIHLYMAQGFKEFIPALGYKGEVIKQYFMNYYYFSNDLTISLGDGRVQVHGDVKEDWTIHLVDTGLHTDTGGRIKRLARWVEGETFMMTYGDGVSDVDLNQLLAFHRSHGKLATMTAERPSARFGSLTLEGQQITRFEEKPQVGEGWINGGFFVLEPGVLDYIEGDHTTFEHEPLEHLARDGELMAYQHSGFWQSMDTLRDVRLLESLWESGKAPWKLWE